MKLWRWVAAGLGVLGLLPGLSGCGTSRADDGRTEIRFCFWGGYEEWQLWNHAKREFEQLHPDIRMKLLYWPGGNYEDKLKLVMAAGTAPDVMSVQDEPFAKYCEINQFEDLTPYVEHYRSEYDPKLFFRTALQTFQHKGRQRALPWNGGQLMVYYNRALFRQAGLPDPPPKDWTIAQFTEYARRLTKDVDGDGRVDQFGYEIAGGWMNSVIPYIWDFGTDIVDPTLQHCTINTPHGVATLQWLHDLRYRDHVAPQPAEFTGATGAIMMTGKLGMEINGPWRIPFMRETDVDWDVWHMPVGPGGERWTRGTWDGMAIYRGSRHKDLAWEWIRFATGMPGQRMVAEAGRAVPPRRAAAKWFLRPDTPQHEERFIEGMEYFRTQRLPLRWPEINVAMLEETEALMATPESDPRATAKTMELRINKILAP